MASVPKGNHPSYVDVEIDEEALRALPEGESVHDQFLSSTEAATSDPGLESLLDEDSGDGSEDGSEVGQGDMADEQPPTAFVPAHELEDHNRSEIEKTFESRRVSPPLSPLKVLRKANLMNFEVSPWPR